jgi:hypothetical protein
LLDVDVYGPSLPVLVKLDDPEIQKSSLEEEMVHPIDYKGVELLSLGFVSPKVRNLIGNGMVTYNSLLGATKTRAKFKVVDKMPVLPFCEARWRQKWSHNCTCIQGKALMTSIDGFVLLTK